MCNNLITKQLQHPSKTLFSGLQIAIYNLELVNIFHAYTYFSLAIFDNNINKNSPHSHLLNRVENGGKVY